MAQLPGRDISFLFILLPVATWLTSSFLVTLRLAQDLFTLARVLFILAWFALHLAQVLFILARVLFNFGLGALHIAQALFTLARVLFNYGLVCPAFSPDLVYFG